MCGMGLTAMKAETKLVRTTVGRLKEFAIGPDLSKLRPALLEMNGQWRLTSAHRAFPRALGSPFTSDQIPGTI